MYQHGEQEAIQRNRPKFWDSRKYALNVLKFAIESVFFLEVKEFNEPVLLDYGCGSMPYKKQFEPLLSQYLGADLDLNDGCDIIIDKEGKLPIEDNSIDIVLSSQVLEHVENPSLYLSEAFRVIRPGGCLIISTHGYWMYHPDPNDYWRWTSAGLQKIITEEGFSIKNIDGVLGRSAVGLQLFQDGLMFKLPTIIKIPFQIVMQILIAVFDKTTYTSTKKSDAGIFIVTATKK